MPHCSSDATQTGTNMTRPSSSTPSNLGADRQVRALCGSLWLTCDREPIARSFSQLEVDVYACRKFNCHKRLNNLL